MALFGRNKQMQADVQSRRVAVNGSSADRRPSFDDLTVGDVSSGVPRIRLGEFFGSLKRQMIWFIPLFLIGTFGAWWFTKDIKRVYHADGTLSVQVGSEYVYDPIGTDQNNSGGLSITPDYIVLSEVPLMKNSDNIERVIGELEAKFGSRFAPDNFAKRTSAGEGTRAYEDALVELHTIVDRSFGVSAQPKSSILSVSYKHEDPEIAKEALNLFIDAYLDFRRTIFVEGSGEVITERRIATEEQLKTNQRAISQFLASNGISDFDSERVGVTKRTEDLRQSLNTLRANISENEQALAAVEDQLRNTPQQLDLEIDDRSSQRLAQAELELGQLLAKYLPNSEPVRRKQAELDQLRRLQNSYGGAPRGGRRVGPNEVFQALLTRRNLLQSTSDALREKEVTVQRQLNSADGKVKKLQGLSARYSDLIRERDTLDERLKDYTTKEQEALINQQQAQSNSENVRVIDRAKRARKGRNMRYLLFALVAGGWGITLAVIALMRAFLDPALYVGSAIRTRRSSDGYEDRRETINSRDAAPMPHEAPVAEQDGGEIYKARPFIPDPVGPAAYPASYANNYNEPQQHADQTITAQANCYGDSQMPHTPPPYQQAAQLSVDAAQYAAEHYAPSPYDGNAAVDIYANPYGHEGSVGGHITPPAAPSPTYHVNDLGPIPRSPEG